MSRGRTHRKGWEDLKTRRNGPSENALLVQDVTAISYAFKSPIQVSACKWDNKTKFNLKFMI